MAPSLYDPLPADTLSIRLIKLQPSNDPSAPILCKLIVHLINSKRSGSHPYECLSYTWGPAGNPKSIEIDTGEAILPFQATPNLHEALLHLRDPYFEQVLWIDAICINQDDDEEKATQVGAMARIYGLAKRVIVWLGVEADGSTLAFQELKDLARTRQYAVDSDRDDTLFRDEEWVEHKSNAKKERCAEQAVHKLFDRPYFRRMWVCGHLRRWD